jgi:hypothetical protein
LSAKTDHRPIPSPPWREHSQKSQDRGIGGTGLSATPQRRVDRIVVVWPEADRLDGRSRLEADYDMR